LVEGVALRLRFVLPRPEGRQQQGAGKQPRDRIGPGAPDAAALLPGIAGHRDQAAVGVQRNAVGDGIFFWSFLAQAADREVAEGWTRAAIALLRVALPDPADGPEALAALVETVTEKVDLDPFELGAVLASHPLTTAVLKALDGQVRTSAEILPLLWRAGAPSWARAVTRQPDVAGRALAAFGLPTVRHVVSVARTPGYVLQLVTQLEATFARMVASLTEETEAIDWYEQRISVEKNKTAKAIMKNAQHEEFKHFGMDLEFLLREKPEWRKILQGILLQDGDIVKHGEQADNS